MLENVLAFGSIGIVIYVIGLVLFWLVPSFVVAHAIKGLNKPQSKKMCISMESDEYYVLDTGVRIFKKWYDLENDCYVCEYGYYLPIRNYTDAIVGFVFIRK